MSDYSWQYRSRPGPFQSFFPPFAGAVKGLVIACAGVFAAQVALQLAGSGSLANLFIQVFGLVPYDVLHGFRIWQLGTYLFLHGGIAHLLFNMLALWMFGSALESEWGRRHFLFYYFLTGVGAGVFSIAVAPGSVVPTIGASGAIYGLLLAFGVLHPNRPIFVYGIFPVKAKWLVLFFGGMALWASWASSGGGIAHIAHLGGMVVGYAYLKRVWRVGGIYREVRWRLRRRRFRVIPRRGNGDPRYPFH